MSNRRYVEPKVSNRMIRTFLQGNFSTHLKRIRRRKKLVRINPRLSRARIKPNIKRLMMTGRCQFTPSQRAASLARTSFLGVKDCRSTMMAIREMKHPARKGRNPEPGSRIVPKPR